MASEAVVLSIIEFTLSSMTYMLPVIAVMAGITFIVTWLMSLTVGLGRRTFKG